MADFVMAGETVHLGIRRALEAHMEAVMNKVLGLDTEPIRPDSPRLRGDDRFAFDERVAAYKRNPHARLRRDPHNGQMVLSEDYVPRGAEARVL